MIDTPLAADPLAANLIATLRAELLQLSPRILGTKADGTTWAVRFLSPFSAPWVQVHVQSAATGGMSYNPDTFISSEEIDCRENRVQDVEVTAIDPDESYIIFLIPVQYDGAGTKVLYDGRDDRPDNMSFIMLHPAGGGATDPHGNEAHDPNFAEEVHTHPASEITAGTFAAGAFAFPSTLDVGGLLTVSGHFKMGGGNAQIFRDVSTEQLLISGGATSSAGANIILMGASHATLANMIRFRAGASERMRMQADGQFSIGTTAPDASAQLQINSATRGLLPPRMSTTARNNIVSPATGLLIFCTTTNQYEFYDGSAWRAVGGLLARTVHHPATNTHTSTTSTTPVDVDATNLAITFTAPASGAVVIVLAAHARTDTSGNADYFWVLREGSSEVNLPHTSGTRVRVGHAVVTAAGDQGEDWGHRTVLIYVSGLTAGTTYTYKFAHFRSAGGTAITQTSYGGANGPAIMEVRAA